MNIEAIGKILSNAIELAIEYRKQTGKPLGITSEVGEYEAALKLNCTLQAARTPGHDLIDCKKRKVQVKTRVIVNKKTQKVPTIQQNTPDKPWDYVVLVLLDENYKLENIYKAEEHDLEELFSKPRPNGSSRNRGLSVRKFISISEKVWPKD